MRFTGRLLTFITLVAVAPLACRSPLERCGEECSKAGRGGAPGRSEPTEQGVGPAGAAGVVEAPPETGEGDAAGAPSGGQGGRSSCDAGDRCEGDANDAAGAGGDPRGHDAECTRDRDCSDAKGCNGVERCTKGRCERGDAFVCSNASECFEAASGASCRYPESDRFVVYAGYDFGAAWVNAVAVRISRLDHIERLNFSEGATDDRFNVIFDFHWSPDGRRLIFPASTSDFTIDVFEQKFFWVDLVGPRAGQARRVPNIPISDAYFTYAWSPASNAVVMGDESGLFAVRFTATGAETAVLSTLGYAEPCDDDATVAYTTEDGTRLAQVWDAPENQTVLPAKLLSRSPDGRWLLLSDEEHAYLARCRVGTELEPLGGPAGVTSSWSPNSDYVVYSDTDKDVASDPTPKALSAFRAESSASHVAVFEAVAADPKVSFEPGSTRFLEVQPTRADELAFHLVDLSDPSASFVLPLPAGIGDPEINDILSHTSWLGNTGRLSFSTSEGETPGIYVIDATATAVPRLVRADGPGDLDFSEDGTRAIWIDQGDGSVGAVSQAYTLDLTRPDSRPHALFAEPLTGSLSLDGARFISRFYETDSTGLDLFVVPPDFESEPVRINAATWAESPTLQPRP